MERTKKQLIKDIHGMAHELKAAQERIAELEAMLKQHANIEFVDSRLHKIAVEEVSKIPTARYIDRLREYRRVTGCSLETAKLAIYKG